MKLILSVSLLLFSLSSIGSTSILVKSVSKIFGEFVKLETYVWPKLIHNITAGSSSEELYHYVQDKLKVFLHDHKLLALKPIKTAYNKNVSNFQKISEKVNRDFKLAIKSLNLNGTISADSVRVLTNRIKSEHNEIIRNLTKLNETLFELNAVHKKIVRRKPCSLTSQFTILSNFFYRIHLTFFRIYFLHHFYWMTYIINEKGINYRFMDDYRPKFQKLETSFFNRSLEMLTNANQQVIRCEPKNGSSKGYQKFTDLQLFANESQIQDKLQDYLKMTECKYFNCMNHNFTDDVCELKNYKGLYDRCRHKNETSKFKGSMADLSFCHCWKNNSARYISLQEAISNTEENKVVAGVRFNIIDNVLHLQILQGKLGKNGVIIRKNISWVSMNQTSSNPTENSTYNFREYENSKIELRLANITASDNRYVVTGIKFVNDGHLYNSAGSHLIGIRVRFSAIDPDKGIIIENSTSWFENAVNNSRPADTVTPLMSLIDNRTIHLKPPSPLSGFGIFMKNIDTKNISGTLLTPTIFSFD